ncbi:MAG: transglutaminase domain-containing protein [Spirochaetes bacterium]|jgi:hypothetical protein|nr:transglutaminase domain-containing protein [Spirochaetota bacterium]
MIKRVNYILFITLVFVLIGCSSDDSGSSKVNPAVQLANLPESVIEYFPLKKSEEALLSCFFDSQQLPDGWSVLSGDPEILDYPAFEGDYSLRLATKPLLNGKISGVRYEADLSPGDYAISFYYRTDINPESGYSFIFEIDGEQIIKAADYSNLWKSRTIEFSSTGSVALSWYVQNSSNDSSIGFENSAWIDCVSLVANEAVGAGIVPSGPQRAVVNDTVIEYQAFALRADNSVISGQQFTYDLVSSGGDGAMDENRFTGTVPGKVAVRAQVEGLEVTSALIEVLDTDNKGDSFVYNDIEYGGAGETGLGSPVVKSDANIDIVQPQFKEFEADAFFTMHGSSSYTGNQKYLMVRIEKEGTVYDTFLSGEFNERIWLPFGKGDYDVTVYRCTVQASTVEEQYDGDILVYSWDSKDGLLYRFKVYNSRNETGAFLYPSGYIQSDSVDIYNLLQRESWYLRDEPLRQIVRLHDYVVAQLVYDMDSLTPARRKKQDALSVLATSSAVCEGYTSLYSALLRCAGFRTRAVAGYGYSSADSKGEAHAWCNVSYNGSWYLTDATWNDDPKYGDDSKFVLRNYLMLETLSGNNYDHEPLDERPSRNNIDGQIIEQKIDISVQ